LVDASLDLNDPQNVDAFSFSFLAPSTTLSAAYIAASLTLSPNESRLKLPKLPTDALP